MPEGAKHYTADALRVYQQGRRVLADELGMDPSDELQELEAAIIRNERSVAAPASPTDRPTGELGRGGGHKLGARVRCPAPVPSRRRRLSQASQAVGVENPDSRTDK